MKNKRKGNQLSVLFLATSIISLFCFLLSKDASSGNVLSLWESFICCIQLFATNALFLLDFKDIKTESK